MRIVGCVFERLHTKYAPSFYAPSLRLKRRAWSGYGFGHTSRREPGDVRGTVIGRKGRFRIYGACKEVTFRERS
jgi:hypothetical protein